MANVWICFAYCVCIHVVSANMTNIAVGKPASGTTDARRAVDGNLTTFTVVQKGKLWWGYMRTVKDAVVKVFFGPEDKRITTNVELRTGNNVFIRPDGKLCHIVKGGTDGTDIPDITANCTGSWEFIAVYTINELNLAEVVVSVCTDGTYGDNCSKSCSSLHCAGSSTSCARYTGACPGGCQTGWAGIDCTDCANGIYGASCNKTCIARHCAEASESCDRQNWACPPGGCTAGWTGTDCTEVCPSGTYGINCSHTCGSRHCVTLAVTCDPVTGQCDMGCTPGWNGTDCSSACPSDTYGPDCNSTCGNCTGDDNCDHVTGSCQNDCKAGWRGRRCKQTCPCGKYGVNCVEACGHCNGTCDMVAGHCPGGCEEGYYGIQCEVRFMSDTGADSASSVVPYVIGAVIGLVAMLLVIGGIALCLFRYGRLQWVKVSSPEYPTQPTALTDIASPHVVSQGLPERSQSTIALSYENDYAVLDSDTKSDNRDYDAIKANLYQNL